jgi:AAA domain
MSLLELIKTGPVSRAQRIVVFGPNGIGKTTLAAKFPSPVFVDVEDGTTHQDVARIQASTGDKFFDALRTLSTEEHPFQTVVIDTIDAAERLIRQRVLKRHKVTAIEDFGYGKGWTYLREEFDAFLGGCLDVFIVRGLHVVVIGHSTVKKVQPPGISDPYDRYELRLDPTNSAKLREWCDALLFINWDVRTTESAQGRVRGVGGSNRVIHTMHSAAHDAKNRVGLPAKIECEFTALLPLLGTAPTPPAAAEPLQQQFAQALSDIDPEWLKAFLIDRKEILPAGSILDVSDAYARRALTQLERFKETIRKFQPATQPVTEPEGAPVNG